MVSQTKCKPDPYGRTRELAGQAVENVEAFLARQAERKAAKAQIELMCDGDKKLIKAEKKRLDFRLPKLAVPTIHFDDPTGTGKTTSLLKLTGRREFSASYFAPTFTKLDEVKAEHGLVIEQSRTSTMEIDRELDERSRDEMEWFRGNRAYQSSRPRPLPSHVMSHCLIPHTVQVLAHYGLPVQDVACQGCKHKDTCPFFNQEIGEAFEAGNDIGRATVRAAVGSQIDMGKVWILDEAILPSLISKYEIPLADRSEMNEAMIKLFKPSVANDISEVVGDIGKTLIEGSRASLGRLAGDLDLIKGFQRRIRRKMKHARGDIGPHKAISGGQVARRVRGHGYHFAKRLERLFDHVTTCIEADVALHSAEIVEGSIQLTDINKPIADKNTALIALDATGTSAIMSRLFPGRHFEKVGATPPRNLHILQIQNSAWNTTFGAGEKGMSKDGANNLKIMHKQCQDWGIGGKVAVFSNKKVAKTFMPEADHGTFGSLRGVNRWEGHHSAVIVGQALRSPRDLERVSGALNVVSGVKPERLEELPDDDEARLPTDDEGYWYHPAPLTHAVYEQMIVAEDVQAIGRLRDVSRKKDVRMVMINRHDIRPFGIEPVEVNTTMRSLPKGRFERYFHDCIQRYGWCLLNYWGVAAWELGRDLSGGIECDHELLTKKRTILNDDKENDLKTLVEIEWSHRLSSAYAGFVTINLLQTRLKVLHKKVPFDGISEFINLNGLGRKTRGKFYNVAVASDPTKLLASRETILRRNPSGQLNSITKLSTRITQIVGPKEVSTKRFDRAPSGAICRLPGVAMPKVWNGTSSFIVEGLEDVEGVLRDVIHPHTGAAVVRGTIKGNARDFERSRDVIKDTPSQLICLDIDDYELPDYLDVREDAKAIAQALPRAMGKPFQGAKCLVSWSASCGVMNGRVAKAHLWFWLDQPMTMEEVRAKIPERIGQVRVDRSTLTELHMLFEGPPVLFDIADPMPERLIMVDGGDLCLADVPDAPRIDEFVQKDEEPKPRKGRVTLESYDEALALIGEDGFHGPILKAVGIAKRLIEAELITIDEAHTQLERAALMAPAGDRDPAYIEYEASRHNFERIFDWLE